VKTTTLLLVSLCVTLLGASLRAQTQSPAPAAPQPVSSPAAATPSASIPPDSPKYGVYPIAYREIITRWLGDRLMDVSTAKLEFDEPKATEVKAKTSKASGYAVDFRVNSKNKFGMYTGFQKYRVLIRNGEIVWADRVRR
jgi:hypothetical protein